MDRADCAVIGAGAIGLAVARALAHEGRDTVILEKATAFGTGTSSRNSEVIHAGLFYPRGSRKARHCVAGRRLLYEYCESRAVTHRRCGKLIVARSSGELASLEEIRRNAIDNGVEDLALLDAGQVRRLEPELAAAGALLSPSTGILDSHGYMRSLLGDAEAGGAAIAYGSRVSRIVIDRTETTLWVNDEFDPALRVRLLVNAAGLDALDLAGRMEGFPPDHIPPGWYAKGHYFALTRRPPFRHLIYPLPEPGGLGVHFTVDLGGQWKLGPDVEWVDSPEFGVPAALSAKFFQAAHPLWPALSPDDLLPAYAGIRPKLSAPGAPAADFHIAGVASHGVTSVINLFGIESPGLTASLAIAEEVAQMAAIALD